MFAEMMAGAGARIVRRYPPDGASYWSQRFWDRDTLERVPVFGDQLQLVKKDIAALMTSHAQNVGTVLEFGCGTGEFTAMAAELTPATEITALDISPQAIEIAGKRVKHPALKLKCGDFWADHGLGEADMVMCVDAIHHLGNVRQVLRRLKSFMAPGAILVGNLWTIDHFHEEQRHKHGSIRHFINCARFFGGALMLRATGGRVRPASYRSHLLGTKEVEPLLLQEFGEVIEVTKARYFVSFVVKA
ncbi:class I SAM-dependent methyltransferase [Sphaerisporangium corydalis]|uniref:Class I SAM-dependent methyltransferase n=1 Tax=Sphaerisporangium corydalis TaxID=1441875 RepID=A0ABV9EEK7_9ACTN|nr:class I SAM-dependent methyltransferase [Sphaerisporangium corydalis]